MATPRPTTQHGLTYPVCIETRFRRLGSCRAWTHNMVAHGLEDQSRKKEASYDNDWRTQTSSLTRQEYRQREQERQANTQQEHDGTQHRSPPLPHFFGFFLWQEERNQRAAGPTERRVPKQFLAKRQENCFGCLVVGAVSGKLSAQRKRTKKCPLALLCVESCT